MTIITPHFSALSAVHNSEETKVSKKNQNSKFKIQNFKFISNFKFVKFIFDSIDELQELRNSRNSRNSGTPGTPGTPAGTLELPAGTPGLELLELQQEARNSWNSKNSGTPEELLELQELWNSGTPEEHLLQ